MSAREPIAIVGLACRFAGGIDSPEKFWELLRDGADTITDVPPGRWDWYAGKGHDHAAAVRGVTSRGAYLDDAAGFDAEFFGIAPREARLMDPQQRIVLELAWEALESAGICPPVLAGTDAGVFVGVGADDYGRRMLEDLPRVQAWSGIGGAYCGVPNRVSYLLDLRGPSIAVDTACSSSLVAIHLAARALAAGECPVALAGGVLVMAAPGLSLVLDAAGALAPDGRCKPFDAGADGYGRGEGGAMIVLKRLRDARRDGDRVLAVIAGSAVHQDGKTNGIMAPSEEAQAHLFRRACADAGVSPSAISFVEAHGTGTALGDPVEARAISAVFGADRASGRPLLIGSVKPNIGHLEAGAGVAGVIKTVLAFLHEELPPTLNFAVPNPAIGWDTAGLRVVTELTPWPAGRVRRRAGVSGYGYGGTIAHVLLEEGDSLSDAVGDSDAGPALYPISAASPAAVRQYAARLADHLGAGCVGTADVGYTLAVRRAHLPRRVAVFASDRAELVGRLAAFGSGSGAVAGVVSGSVLPLAGRGLVWVFSGHGSQWPGMGSELAAGNADFAAVIDALEPVFAAELKCSLRALLADRAPLPTDLAQPAIFALQVALAAVWRGYGVTPAAVIGHSVGEIAAAVVAGILTLEQGARLVCRRSVLLRQVVGGGAMFMVNLGEDAAERRIAGWPGLAVAVAASSRSSVISGPALPVGELAGRLRAEGLDVRLVGSDVAFHSSQMDPLLGALADAAADLPAGRAAIPVYSTALDDPRSARPRDGAYWAANLRGRVRFAQAVAAAAADGYRLFAEVSAHPVVEYSVIETLAGLGLDDFCVTHSLRRRRPETATLLGNLGTLYCHGAEVDWTAVWGRGRLADLPPRAWQHQSYWLEEAPVGAGAMAGGGHDPASHTLLGARASVSGTTPATVWQTLLDRESRPYPGTHPVHGVEIVPAAVLLTTFLAAASADGTWSDLVDVGLRVPVTVTRPREIQVVLQDGMIRLSSRVAERTADHGGWVTHTTAMIEPSAGLPPNPRPGPGPAPGPGAVLAGVAGEAAARPRPSSEIADRLASVGVAAMGFTWAVEDFSCGDGTMALTVSVDSQPGRAPVPWAPVLDAVLSAASLAFGGPPALRMPAHLRQVTLARQPPGTVRAVIAVTSQDTVDVEITDRAGAVVGRLTQLRYGRLDSDTGVLASPRRLVHELIWSPARAGVADTRSAAAVVGPAGSLITAVQDGLSAAGFACRLVAGPEDLVDADLAGDRVIVVVPPPCERAGDEAGAAESASWLLARAAQRLIGAGSGLGGSGQGGLARLWCVTQGVGASERQQDLGHAGAWGLGRVIGGEHPEFWGGIIDVGYSPHDLHKLGEVMRTVRGEDIVVVTDGRPRVARLRRVGGEPVKPPLTCRPDGTYLITGGLGSLGLQVGRWLADRGARRIVLVGRHGLPPREQWDRITDPRQAGQVREIRALERLGVTVLVVALDVADLAAARPALDSGALGVPPVKGVVHAAGVVDNLGIHALTEPSLRAVMRPKVAGALVLHELFPPGSVDFFVLFSSCGQLLGLPGQASYAAGNAFLDALAAHRRALGDTAAASFGWTSWRGLGLSTSSAVTDAELAARGVADITPTEAFSAWWLADRYDLGYAAILRTTPVEPGERKLPLLSELPADPQPAEAAEPAAARAPWRELAAADLHAYLVDEASRQVAAETGHCAGEIDVRRPLADLGVDSVMTVRIRRGLERHFRLDLPATLFWERPTIDALAAYLGERVAVDTALTSERLTG